MTPRTESVFKSGAAPVGLTLLKGSSKPIRCPSCGRTGKTIVRGEDDGKTGRAVGLAIAAVCAVATFGLCVCLVPLALQRFASASALHYCGHCSLRLAFYSASADTCHVFVEGYLAWLVNPQRDSRLLTVASPFGGPPDATGVHRQPQLNSVAFYSHDDIHVNFEVCPWPSFYGAWSLPATLLRGSDGSSFRVTGGGTAGSMTTYRPHDREPDAAWHINAPQARLYFHSEGGEEEEEEIARVRVWGRQQKAVFYLGERDSESSVARRDWSLRATCHTMEPVSGLGFDVNSSMGPLLWTHRATRGAADDPEVEPTERLLLLDAYDRVVAAEVPDTATPSALSLCMYGNLTTRFVEEIAASYAVRKCRSIGFTSMAACWHPSTCRRKRHIQPTLLSIFPCLVRISHRVAHDRSGYRFAVSDVMAKGSEYLATLARLLNMCRSQQCLCLSSESDEEHIPYLW